MGTETERLDSIAERFTAECEREGVALVAVTFVGGHIGVVASEAIVNVKKAAVCYALGAVLASFADPGNNMDEAITRIRQGYVDQRAAIREEKARG